MLTLVACQKSEPASPSTPPFINPTPDQIVMISTILPTYGGYNTTLTIIGKNFSTLSTKDTVKVNGRLANVLMSKSDTLVVTIPLAAGTGPVSVTVDGKTAVGPVFTYTSNLIVSTLAGNGLSDGFNGASTISPIHNPVGVALDDQGYLYVSEYNRITKIAPSGAMTVLAGDGNRGFVNGRGDTARFSPVTELAVDKNGNVYVADRDNQRIRKITPTGFVSTLAGGSSYGYVDASGNDARFWTPVAVAVDRQGNVYVSDRSNQRIRKITPQGIVSTLAGNGNTGFKDGPGTQAEFHNPAGLTVDLNGNVYVADERNCRIRKMAPDGTVSTIAGSGAISGQNGPVEIANFSSPSGVAIDKEGNIYVADQDNQTIRKIAGGMVTTFAGNGQKGYADGALETAMFYYPQDVAVDDKGNVYVADRANHRIRKIGFQ